MLFNPEPKDRREDLYDFERELEDIRRALRLSRMVLVTGFRRTGKTSLIKVSLNEVNYPSIFFDLRLSVYPNFREIAELLVRGVADFVVRHESFLEKVKRIRGLRVVAKFPPVIEVVWSGVRKLRLASVFEKLNEWGEETGSEVVVVFDEAQEFAKVKWLRIDRLFAYVYDHLRRVKLLLSGSQFGLLYDFLGVDNPKAPLFGRPYAEIRTRRLSIDESKDFLRRGFRQYNFTIGEGEIEEASRMFGGIIGWLTYYGHLSVIYKRPVLREVMERASELALQELNNFLETRRSKRYLALLKILRRPMRWGELKRDLENYEGRSINDSEFNNILQTLVKSGYVEKVGELYRITDPVLKYALSKS